MSGEEHPLHRWAVAAASEYDRAVADARMPETMASAFLAADLLAASIDAAQRGHTEVARWLLERAGLAANHRLAALKAAQVQVPDDLSGLQDGTA